MFFTALALLGFASWNTSPSASAQGKATPTPTDLPDDALTEPLSDFLVLRYDPATKTIYIDPIDPSLKVVIRGQGSGSSAQSPAAAAATAVPGPSPTPLHAESLRGKIIFKSTRDHGEYPSEFLYYLMDADGTNVQQLDTQQAKNLLDVIQGLEGFSPDRKFVAMGDRACGTYFENNCELYILEVDEHAKMIFSDQEPSQGVWFAQPNVKAKEPVWSPRGDYIVFASNHENPDGCRKTQNLFKGTPKQNPTIRRLTSYCAGANTGRPSFNPEGTEVVYWTQFPGPSRDLYIIEVGADNGYDWRSAVPKRITFQGDNWDPVWIK
jgi:hypothetical protein